jgi:hypothetical protein
MTIHRRLAPLFMFAISATAYAACGGTSPRALCQDACDCMGCSNSELEECVEELEDAQEYAEKEGCSDEFDSYLDCLSGFQCDGDDIEVPDECEDLEDDLNEACGDDDVTVSGGDLCQLAANKVSSCQGDPAPPPGQGAQCTGTVECVAQCVLDADCGAFDGSDAAAQDAFNVCATSCSQ